MANWRDCFKFYTIRWQIVWIVYESAVKKTLQRIYESFHQEPIERLDSLVSMKKEGAEGLKVIYDVHSWRKGVHFHHCMKFNFDVAN